MASSPAICSWRRKVSTASAVAGGSWLGDDRGFEDRSHKPGDALGVEARDPFCGGLRRGVEAASGGGGAQPLVDDGTDHLLSTFGRQAGIVVGVHSVPRCEVGVSQLQLPRSGPNGQPPECSHLEPTPAWLHHDLRASPRSCRIDFLERDGAQPELQRLASRPGFDDGWSHAQGGRRRPIASPTGPVRIANCASYLGLAHYMLRDCETVLTMRGHSERAAKKLR